MKNQIRNWHLISARGGVLGRLATRIAVILMGKNKRDYMPNLDHGDYVVVVDAKDVVVTGKKEKQKLYQYYSGYPGGRKTVTLSATRKTHPERIIEHAVSGMLPGNKLKSQRMARLKVFSGSEHPYGDKIKS